MQKKILLTVLTILLTISNHTSAASEMVKIVPIKKPSLSDSELKKKVLINI